MGWGITIESYFERIYCNKFSFSDIDDIDDKISDLERFLSKIEKELLVFPLLFNDKLQQQDYEELESNHFNYVHEFDEIITSYRETIEELNYYERIKDIISYDHVAIYDDCNDKYYVKEDGKFVEVTREKYEKYKENEFECI